MAPAFYNDMVLSWLVRQIWVQFHQHFWRQSKYVFAQITFDAFKGNSVWLKCTKIWHSVQKLLLQMCCKISAEVLVKQKSTFCAICFMLALLQIAQIGWQDLDNSKHCGQSS
jgi:hypothetical protein